MANGAVRVSVLFVIFTLIFVLAAVRLETISKITKPAQTLDPIMPSQYHQMHDNLEKSSERLKSIKSDQELNNYFSTGKISKVFQYSLGQTQKNKRIPQKYAEPEKLIDKQQNNILTVNSSLVVTAFTDNICIGLNFFNLTTKTYNSMMLKYRYGFQSTVLSSFGENSLIINSDRNFVLMNLTDLTITQQIYIQMDVYTRSEYYIDALIKNQSGVLSQTILLGARWIWAHLVQFNYKTNKFENITEFYKPYGDMFLTSKTEGMTFWNLYKVPVDLTKQFRIQLKYNPKQFPDFPLFSVISNSEQIIALIDLDYPDTTTGLQFYRFNKTNYDMEYLYKFVFLKKFVLDQRKIRFASDDKFIFFNVNHTKEKYRSVCVLNVESREATYFDLENGQMTDLSCLDYGILSNTQFVIICKSFFKIMSTSVQENYQLFLYNMSNFKLLDTYSLMADAVNVQVKTNPSFNGNFLIQFISIQNKPTHRLFSVLNNKIATASLPENLTGFRIVTDCLNYLIGIYSNEVFHTFINVKNYTVAKRTQIYDINSIPDPRNLLRPEKYYLVQENILGICNKQGGMCQMFEFYDLSKIGIDGEPQFLCNFYMVPTLFFLHKEKYAFLATYSRQIDVYDLQKCPTKKMIPLQLKYEPLEFVSTTLYKRTSPCNLIYFLTNLNKIHVVEDCQPYRTRSVTSIPNNLYVGYQNNVEDISFSANGKYLIIYMDLSEKIGNGEEGMDVIDIRSLSNLEKSLYRTRIPMWFRYSSYYVGVTDNDQLLYSNSSGLFLEKMNVKGQQQEKEYAGSKDGIQYQELD